MTRLSAKEFAIRTGCDEDALPRLAELGIVRGEDGAFDAADVNRVRLAIALESAGIALPILAEALQSGRISLDFAAQLMFEPVGLTGRRASEVLNELGMPPPVLRKLRGAMGLSELEPAQPLRDDDLEMLELIAGARAAGLSDDGLARVLRVFGQSARRTAEAMRDLFRSQVEEPTLARGGGPAQMLTSTAAMRLKLQRAGFRTLFLLQRRMLEDAVFDNVATRMQEVFADAGRQASEGHNPPTVVFADLAGFTALTHDLGDAAAVEQAATFEALAYETAVDAGGHFIKALGDGVMILFREAAAAAETSLRLDGLARNGNLQPLKIGLATGAVVPRDGDIFGRTVNLAARIMGQAERNQILACSDTADRLRPGGALKVDPLPAVRLRGFPDPVPLFRLSQPAEG